MELVKVNVVAVTVPMVKLPLSAAWVAPAMAMFCPPVKPWLPEVVAVAVVRECVIEVMGRTGIGELPPVAWAVTPASLSGVVGVAEKLMLKRNWFGFGTSAITQLAL